MNLIICLDDRNGMLFGGRRQSRDRVVCEKMIQMTSGCKLWMNSYSGKLFAEMAADILVDEAFLAKADKNDYCFVENIDVLPYIDNVGRLIVFKWNRQYPADLFFRVELVDAWKLCRTEVFPGYSHKNITMEEYVR